MFYYANENEIIKQLLETNIRQRGTIDGSSIKLGRRIRELERVYGIKHGNNQHNEDFANGEVLTQDDLLKQLGITKDTYHRAKSLTTLPTEIQDLVESGNISPSTASRLIAKLSPSEQEQLIEVLPATQKLTQKQVQGYVEKLNFQCRKYLMRKSSHLSLFPVFTLYHVKLYSHYFRPLQAILGVFQGIVKIASFYPLEKFLYYIKMTYSHNFYKF